MYVSGTVRVAAVAVIVASAAVVVGCSGNSSETGTARGHEPPSTSTTTTREMPHDPEIFDGAVDDFYVVPDPLPPGKPGELIRLQHLGEAGGRATSRIMYHSNDARGRDRAVTGTLTYPTGPAPAGRWPVISTAHGTSGIASKCALSRTGEPAPGWGVDGVYRGIDPIVTTILTMMSLYGGASEHPDLVLSDYLTPDALTAAKVFETACLDEITNALIPVAVAGPFLHDQRTTATAPLVTRWIEDRLAGAPSSDTCPTQPAPEPPHA